MFHVIFGVLVLLFPLFSTEAELRVLRVSPQGTEVENQRQIAIKFDQDMLELGAMNPDQKEIPIVITPAINCSWRWIDLRNLACELSHNEWMAPATEYEIKISKDLKSLNGDSLSEEQSYRFSTVRPKINRISLLSENAWGSPVRPKIILELNMDVTNTELKKFLSVKQGKSIKYGIVERKEQRYGKLHFYRTLVINEDLARDAEFEVQVKPGYKSTAGELTSTEELKETFKTLPHFKIERVVCHHSVHGKRVFSRESLNQLIDANDGDLKCEPHLPKQIIFSNNLIPKEAYQKIGITPDPSGQNTEVNPFSSLSSYELSYHVNLLSMPSVLKSRIPYKIDLSNVENIYGEKLADLNQIDIVFGPRSPTVIPQYRRAVIEKGIGNDVPVLVTNSPRVDVKYQSWTSRGLTMDRSIQLTNSAPEDISLYSPLEVEKMLDGKSGMVAYEIAQGRKGSQEVRYAQVTPYQVYAKLGYYNSLVWVLDLQTGEPIADAIVKVVDWAGLNELMPGGRTDSQGVALLSGVLKSKASDGLFNNQYAHASLSYVSVEKNGELALLPLSPEHRTTVNYEFDYDYYYGTKQKESDYKYLVSWGTTPQGVYRAGSEIDYKVYVRVEELKNLAIPPDLIYELSVIDPLGKEVFNVKELKLTEFGTLNGSFKVPMNAVFGDYEFQLTAHLDKQGRKQKMTPMKVLVSDFTPAPFKVGVDIDKNTYLKGESINITARATMHAGGAHTGTEARTTVLFQSLDFVPKIDKYKKYFLRDRWSYRRDDISTLSKRLEPLNEQGEMHSETKLSMNAAYGKLFIEAAAKDDRGKFISTSTNAEYFGRQKYLGRRLSKGFYKSGEEIEVEYIVLNPQSKAIKNVDVRFELELQQVNTVKVKGSGNAYVTRNEYKWVPENSCSKRSSDEVAKCSFKPTKAGYYSIKAFLEGTLAFEDKVYVVGPERVWWGDGNTDQISIDVEKTDLQVSETVDVLIRNPFPKAKALITVERYGILDQWTVDINESLHVFKLQVKPDYIPGFYLSVELFSPRVQETSGFGNLDLGKPTYRTGTKVFKVNDPYKRIDVSITSDKEQYLPNEVVKLFFDAKARNGELEDVELAVAVIDESVFDLIKDGEKYFDAYEGLANLKALDVKSFNLIKMLIGRQKFEKKGANQGGGGGMDIRSNINFLAYWNPSLVLKKGRGSASFSLPDNLTGWKVIVMSADKKDRLGLSLSRLVTRLPTEIRPALPNFLVENDRFKARFTVLNREEAKRKIDIVVAASGLAKGELEKSVSYDLGPNEKKNVEIDLEVGLVAQEYEVRDDYVSFLVKAGDDFHQDTFVTQVKVQKRRPGYWASQYESLVDQNKKEMTIRFPDNIYHDVGGLEVTASTTLIGFIEDGLRYFQNYPYTCWEQILSKGLAAAQYLKLSPYLKNSLEWNDADLIVKETIARMADFQLSDGSMSYYGRYHAEYLSAYTGLALSWLQDYGHEIEKVPRDNLVKYLKKMLSRDVFNNWNTTQSKASTRAVALAALAGLGELSKGDLARYQSSLSQMDQFGRVHFYLASLNEDPKYSKAALNLMLGSLSVDSGSVRFNEKIDPSLNYVHYSQRRTQCASLMSITEAYRNEKNLDLIDDLPIKLARSVVKDMQVQGKFWNSTQDSIYCMNALISYARTFEKQKPKLTMEVWLDDQKLGEQKFNDFSLTSTPIRHHLREETIGKSQKLRVEKKGVGTVHYKTTMSYSLKEHDRNIYNGINLKKMMSVKRDGSWHEVKAGMVLKRGELISVDLLVEVGTARHYVVVDDPIAAGFEPLNSNIATVSQVDIDDKQRAIKLMKDTWKTPEWYWYDSGPRGFYYKELRNDRAIFYSEFLMPGSYYLNYKAQVVATGEFTSMPTLAQEMYNPETFSTLSEKRISIEE